MFGLPLAVAAIQVLLLLFVFPYETPKVLKQNKQFGKLNSLMNKIYDNSLVPEKITEIVVESDSKESSSPTYGETLCHPRYKLATTVGILLSIF